MAIVVVNDGCYGGTDALISILLFIFGFCFWIPWLIGAFCIRSPDVTARAFGIASCVLYFLAFFFSVIFFPVYWVRGPAGGCWYYHC